MGSAFYAEPLYGQSAADVVTFLMFPSDDTADLLVHQSHGECALEGPDRIGDCGRFRREADEAEHALATGTH
jgi:hypothetical protein